MDSAVGVMEAVSRDRVEATVSRRTARMLSLAAQFRKRAVSPTARLRNCAASESIRAVRRLTVASTRSRETASMTPTALSIPQRAVRMYGNVAATIDRMQPLFALGLRIYVTRVFF